MSRIRRDSFVTRRNRSPAINRKLMISDNHGPQEPPLIIAGSGGSVSTGFDRDPRRGNSWRQEARASFLFRPPPSRSAEPQVQRNYRLPRNSQPPRRLLPRRINRELSIDGVESRVESRRRSERETGERGARRIYPCRSREPGGLAERRFWLIAFAEKRR